MGRGALLSSALAGQPEASLVDQASRLRRLAARARNRLGRALEPLEVWALAGRLATIGDTAPSLVVANHLAAAGEWLLVDAAQGDLEITVPASVLGDELRVRRRDTSSHQALLVGAFTANLGPGHALLLKGEPDGAWGAW